MWCWQRDRNTQKKEEEEENEEEAYTQRPTMRTRDTFIRVHCTSSLKKSSFLSMGTREAEESLGACDRFMYYCMVIRVHLGASISILKNKRENN